MSPKTLNDSIPWNSLKFTFSAFYIINYTQIFIIEVMYTIIGCVE